MWLVQWPKSHLWKSHFIPVCHCVLELWIQCKVWFKSNPFFCSMCLSFCFVITACFSLVSFQDLLSYQASKIPAHTEEPTVFLWTRGQFLDRHGNLKPNLYTRAGVISQLQSLTYVTQILTWKSMYCYFKLLFWEPAKLAPAVVSFWYLMMMMMVMMTMLMLLDLMCAECILNLVTMGGSYSIW